jgi:hypothetical protein
MLYCCLVLNIWYQSSRSWGFAATSETPWHFRYNVFSTMFQKERLGGYLEDGSREEISENYIKESFIPRRVKTWEI